MLDAEPWPPSGAIRFVLAGAALKALGRNEEARVALERALKMDPTKRTRNIPTRRTKAWHEFNRRCGPPGPPIVK